MNTLRASFHISRQPGSPDRILHLTMKKEAFVVIRDGFKQFECRDDTPYNRSRLLIDDDNNRHREYDYVAYYCSAWFTSTCAMVMKKYYGCFFCSLDIKLGPYDNSFEMIWPANSWVIVHDQKSFVDRPFQSKKKKN